MNVPNVVSMAVADAPVSERMLDRKELSKRWGVSTKTLINWQNVGRLPFVRLGPRLVRYRAAEVERLEVDMGIHLGRLK